MARNELEILRDWCTEAVSIKSPLNFIILFTHRDFIVKVYNVLIHPINTSKALNYKYHLKIIDVGDVEVRFFCSHEENVLLFIYLIIF